MRGIRGHARRHTLLLCLLQRTQAATRDELALMFLRCMRRIRKAAKDRLLTLQEQHRELEAALIAVLGRVISSAKSATSDRCLGRQVRDILTDQGGIEVLGAHYEAVFACLRNNELPSAGPCTLTFSGTASPPRSRSTTQSTSRSPRRCSATAATARPRSTTTRRGRSRPAGYTSETCWNCAVSSRQPPQHLRSRIPGWGAISLARQSSALLDELASVHLDLEKLRINGHGYGAREAPERTEKAFE